MYGCIVVIRLLEGFLKVLIFSSSIVVQSGLEIFISWWLHELISGLIVTINANSICGVGYCVFLFTYLSKCGKFLVAFI